MSVATKSNVYKSGEYYRNVYIPKPLDLRLSRLWMIKHYRVICNIFPKFKHIKSDKILEIGSGFGGFINLLSTLGYHNITASDMCQDIYNPDPAYDFKIINIENYQSNQKYKVIVALDVMEHIKYQKKAIVNINKLLKNRGYFIFCVPYPLKIHLLDPYHINMHFPKYYLKIFSDYGFKLCNYKTVSFIPFIWRFGFHISIPGIISSRYFITETFYIFQKIS